MGAIASWVDGQPILLPVSKLYSRLGRRGLILSLLGLLWLAQAVTTMIIPPSEVYVMESWSGVGRGLLWGITGLVAIAYSVRSAGADAPGFLALYIMASYRILAYVVGFIQWLLPGPGGDVRGVVGAMSWLVIITLIIVISGWREHADDLELRSPDPEIEGTS